MYATEIEWSMSRLDLSTRGYEQVGRSRGEEYDFGHYKMHRVWVDEELLTSQDGLRYVGSVH